MLILRDSLYIRYIYDTTSKYNHFTSCYKFINITPSGECEWRQILWVMLVLPHWGQGKPGNRYADDIFKFIFLTENYSILIQVPLVFIPMGSVNNKRALVQIAAWHRTGDKPSSELMMA